MQIYHYDQNGLYLGASAADQSPLEPGVFLIPAQATPVKPPSARDGFLRRFVNGTWEEQYLEPVPEVAPPIEPEAPTDTLPQVVSRAQGLIALEMAGVLVQIEDYMLTATRLEQLAWNNIQQFERQSPLLNTLCTNFELSQEDVDNLFLSASQVVI